MQKISFAVTCRAIIVDKGELFMAKHHPRLAHYALPGGKLEVGETLTACVAREIFEELAVQPQVGKLLFVNDWVDDKNHQVEFFFWIKNAADYRRASITSSTHGFELVDTKFADPTKPGVIVLPSFLRDRFPQLLELGENFPTELIHTGTEKKTD
jgi:ADP-ribose pyrophosphatase YjhB (NUDIX family)